MVERQGVSLAAQILQRGEIRRERGAAEHLIRLRLRRGSDNQAEGLGGARRDNVHGAAERNICKRPVSVGDEGNGIRLVWADQALRQRLDELVHLPTRGLDGQAERAAHVHLAGRVNQLHLEIIYLLGDQGQGRVERQSLRGRSCRSDRKGHKCGRGQRPGIFQRLADDQQQVGRLSGRTDNEVRQIDLAQDAVGLGGKAGTIGRAVLKAVGIREGQRLLVGTPVRGLDAQVDRPGDVLKNPA